MVGKATILLLAVTAAGINAARLAAFVPRDLSARTVNPVGGWSLAQTTAATCPVDAPQCGAQWCCPGTLTCIHTAHEDIGEVCCPTDTDCSATFTAAPSCADSSWSLWNATSDTADAAGYFCCLQGQVGLQNGYCIDSANAATAGPPAVELTTSTGAVHSETSIASTATSSTAVVTTTNTVPTSTLSVTVVSSTRTINSTESVKSTGTTSVPTTSVSKATPAGTSSSAPATTSAATVTGKSEAVGFKSLGGTSLGVVLAAVFALALL